MTKMHFSALSFALLLPLGGCEVQDCDNEETDAEGLCIKSLKRWDSPAETMETAYTAGASVSIDSPNGDVRVVRGDSTDTVSATFERFVLRAYDTPDEEAEADLESLELYVGPDNGDVVVDVSRPSGSPSSLGADVSVALPTTFDGVLEVHCNNGDLTASINGVSAQTGSGFSTGNGSVELSLPSEGVFSVQAQAHDGGVVTINGLPDTCSVNEASEAAKTVSCNGATTQDPIYVADAEGTGLADVILNF